MYDIIFKALSKGLQFTVEDMDVEGQYDLIATKVRLHSAILPYLKTNSNVFDFVLVHELAHVIHLYKRDTYFSTNFVKLLIGNFRKLDTIDNELNWIARSLVKALKWGEAPPRIEYEISC